MKDKKQSALSRLYEKWTLDYTKSMMIPMIGFTVFSNGIFAALILAAYILGGNTANCILIF